MILQMLKPIRVIISLLFFLITLFVFVDFAAVISAKGIHTILYLQFVPSLIEFIGVATVASAGFLFILLGTLLFGRIYCSSVCPIGTLQDIVSGIRKRLNREKKYRYQKSLPWLKYPILILTATMLAAGNLFLITILDPFSLAGRIFSGLFRPLGTMANNLLSVQLPFNYVDILNPVPLHFQSWPVFLVTITLFIAIILLALYRGRWYCTELCPVGALLGLLSKISLFRIRIDETECKACGTCISACKAGCIDGVEHRIEYSRCIACFNCLNICPQKGIRYKIQGLRDEVQGLRFKDKVKRLRRPDLNFEYQTPNIEFGTATNNDRSINSRRDFFKTIFLTISALAVSKLSSSQGTGSSQEEYNPYPAIPPGSVSFWHYTEKCTSCHLCISACPTQVLQPALMEFGLTGILQPKMDFESGFCKYDCHACTDVCPSGAILPLTTDRKHGVQIGISKLIRNLCIPVDEDKACGLCKEKCPTGAIEMVPYLGDLTIPAIDEKTCVGCGSCEFICPTRPIRAIYVEPHRYHRKAMKPLSE